MIDSNKNTHIPIRIHYQSNQLKLFPLIKQANIKQIRFTHPSVTIDLNVLIYPTATRQNLAGRDKRQREIVVGHPAIQYFDAARTAIAAAALVFDLVAGALQALQ